VGYFWSSDMILVKRIRREDIERVIKQLIIDVNLKEYLVVVNNRLIPLTGAITENQLIDPAIALLQLLVQVCSMMHTRHK
jgi:hypothetical protein